MERKKWFDTGEIERTEVLYNFEDILACALDILPKIQRSHDVCLDIWGPSVILGTEVVKNGYVALHNKGVKTRLITQITKENITHCKEFMKFAEVRHLDKVKGHFSISDTRWYTASAESEKDKPPPRLIYSTVKEIVQQHQYFFETLWHKAIPAELRIKEIEEGIEPTNLEFISNPKVAIEQARDLIRAAKQEVMVMLSSPNTFRRQFSTGGLEVIQQAIRNGAKVKLLIPSDINVVQALNQTKSVLPGAEIRAMDASLTTSITIILVDHKQSMFFELKDDAATESHQAVGLSLYSESKSIVSSYTAILEAIWKQSELYEQIRQANEKLKDQEKLQKEFINVAAHELRTPVQPLIGVVELIQQTLDGKEKAEVTKEELNMMVRNAKRLERLSSDLLQVSRIESGSLKLNKESVNMNEKIRNVIKDLESFIPKDKHLDIIFESKPTQPLMVEADKPKIFEVLSNLLRNAINFTDGTIQITLEKHDGQAIVYVRDTGPGIDPEVLPKLFTKFATRSEVGTGLGLYISKSIIEAHGGRIWGENNKDGKGASFAFTLPLTSRSPSAKSARTG